MFEMNQTFTHETGFHITPIEMQGVGFIFIPQELESQLGYENLPDMVRKSESFAEGIEYVILRNSKLRLFKELLRRRNSIPSVEPNVNAFIILTEAGLYTTMFLSRKPHAQAFRRWVTCEVLPSIRQTGMYKISSIPSPAGDVSKLVNRLASLESKIAQLSTDQKQFQQYALQGFDRIEAVLSEALPHNMFEGYQKIRWLVDNMTAMYDLSEHERRRYTRELCQTHGVQLPEKAFLGSESLFHDAQELAIKIGVYSTNDKPHSRLMVALIRHLGLDQEQYCRKFPLIRRGYATTVPKYSDNVIPHIVKWLQERNYPETIELVCGDGKSRKFQVKHRIR